MIKLIFLLLFPSILMAQLTDVSRQEIVQKNIMASFNPGFESGKASWVASGGTFSAVTSGTNLLVGKGSSTWDSNSASQTLSGPNMLIPKGLYGQNGVAQCLIQTPSGTATHKIQVYDGTNVIGEQPIFSSTTPSVSSVSFIFPTSGSLRVRLISVASNEPLVALDDCYLGKNFLLADAELTTEWKSYTPTFTGLGTVSNVAFEYRRQGPNLKIRGSVMSGTSTATPGTFSLPPGLKIASTAYDATNFIHVFGYYINATTSTSVISNGDYIGGVIVNYPSDDTVVSFQARTINGEIFNDNASTLLSSGARIVISGELTIPIQGWNTVKVYQSEVPNWLVDAEIYNQTNGNYIDYGTSDSALFVPSQGDQQLFLKSHSIPAKIACSGTNPPTGLTCSSGNEQPGINFDVPTAGVVEACFSFNHYVDTTSGRVQTNFQIVETASDSQTVLQNCGPSIISGIDSGTQGSHHPTLVCGRCNFSSSGNKTLRLAAEVGTQGTVSLNALYTIGAGDYGQAKLAIKVKPVNQSVSAPVLVNSVVSSYAGVSAVEHASVNTSCTGSPCTITSQSGCFSSITRASTGNYTANYSCGFTSVPTCTLTGTEYNFAYTAMPSTTAMTFVVADAGGTASDAAFHIMCMGKK